LKLTASSLSLSSLSCLHSDQFAVPPTLGFLNVA
jgi:hypothetical protein